MKSKRKYRSKTRMKTNKINYITIFAIIILFIIGIGFIVLGFNDRDKVIPIYSYSAQKNSDYKVLLNPNDFYEREVLPSGGYYASNSINTLEINFRYDYKGNKEQKIAYNYNIVATIVGIVTGNNDEDKEVWSRDFTLLDNNNFKQANIKEFNINENINIDYGYYNNFARSYEETYGIKIETILKVVLNINYNIADENQENDYIELDIPITNTVTEVKGNYEKETYRDIMQETGTNSTKEIIYYVIGGLFIVGGVAVIIIKIQINKTKQTPEGRYNSNINRILKYYRDLIVTVTNEPNISSLRVMNIGTLNDLIDVAEQNKTNIIHYETIKNEKSNLYVIVDDYVYVYEVKDQNH